MRDDSRQVQTLSRQDLYDAVWTKPIRDVARELGVSDVGLAKLCRRHAIPTPERGYWSKLRHGKSVPRPPLPDASPPEAGGIVITPSGRDAPAPPSENLEIPLASTLIDPHPLVTKTVASLANAKVDEKGRVIPRSSIALPVCIAPLSVDRAARLLDALVKGLERRGHALRRTALDGRDRLAVSVNGESIAIEFLEELDREVRPRSRSEQEQRERNPWLNRSAQYRYSPSGRLRLGIDHYNSFGLRRHWTDGSRQRLEQCLGAFVLQLERFAEAIRGERERRDELTRRQRVWEAERADKLKQIDEEEDRVRALDREVEAWQRSQRIREYVSAVRAAASRTGAELSAGSKLARWLDWATMHADRKCSPDPIWWGGFVM